MSVKYFEDLSVWKLSRELTDRIYKITGSGEFSKDYGLRDQIRRASVSIMSNIAEGFERGGKVRGEFLYIQNCLMKKGGRCISPTGINEMVESQ